MKVYFMLRFLILGVVKINKVESVAQCGVTYYPPSIGNRPLHRIVGGSEAKPNSYPWLGSVQEDKTHYCGGALIRVSDLVDASDILITAAHCGEPTHVLLGAHSLSQPRQGQKLLAVTKTIPHPEWNSNTVANDISILKLEKAVSFSQTIQPACLPTSGEQINEGAPGIVAGWGYLKENGGASSDLLQQAVLPVFNIQKCQANYVPHNHVVDAKDQFCAGHATGKIDSCSQDSGGPYVLKNSNGRYVLQGVVSFGKGCARANLPGVYTRVSAYIPWINDQVKNFTSVKS